VIDFGERTREASACYAGPWRRLDATVRPERQGKDATKYPRMVYEWWKFWNGRPGMRRAIARLPEVLAMARVSKSVMPVRVLTGPVPSDATVVFATDSYADQVVLSSGLHQSWAIKYGSGMRADPRYTPSDVFETFPRPAPTDRLEAAGRRLDEERREIMLRRDLGLTKLYNLVNDPDLRDSADPDVRRLRKIHVEIDEAVLEAYGWDDIALDHGFYTYRQMTRWTFSPEARVEILDRLLEDNHRRAAAQGSAPEPTADEVDDLEDTE